MCQKNNSVQTLTRCLVFDTKFVRLIVCIIATISFISFDNYAFFLFRDIEKSLLPCLFSIYFQFLSKFIRAQKMGKSPTIQNHLSYDHISQLSPSAIDASRDQIKHTWNACISIQAADGVYSLELYASILECFDVFCVWFVCMYHVWEHLSFDHFGLV